MCEHVFWFKYGFIIYFAFVCKKDIIKVYPRKYVSNVLFALQGFIFKEGKKICDGQCAGEFI